MAGVGGGGLQVKFYPYNEGEWKKVLAPLPMINDQSLSYITSGVISIYQKEILNLKID